MSARIKVDCTDPKLRRKIRATVRKHKLDRRRLYVVGSMGELATNSKFTDTCSGCSCDCGDGYGCSHGAGGCEECGFTGKRVNYFPDPVRVGDRYIQITPAQCYGCGKEIEHFDAGCADCVPTQ